MTKIFLHMVVKNEADRLLQECLNWNSQYFDEAHFFDDRSTDDTPSICAEYGTVNIRQSDMPSFVDDEGAFRTQAWKTFKQTCDPSEDDWVFVLDADEFLVMNDGYDISEILVEAENNKSVAIKFKIPEVWARKPPRVRVDGYWDSNFSVRATKYVDEPFNSGLGCGSTPAMNRNKQFVTDKAVVLHYGYSVEGEPERKHTFYSEQPGKHNPNHIDSIIRHPILKIWDGDNPLGTVND